MAGFSHIIEKEACVKRIAYSNETNPRIEYYSNKTNPNASYRATGLVYLQQA
jgi:hypothetical protein